MHTFEGGSLDRFLGLITKISKSGALRRRLAEEILSKAIGKTKLIQVPVEYKKKDGSVGKRMQWVSPDSRLAKEYRAKQQDGKADGKGVSPDASSQKKPAAKKDAGKKNTYAENKPVKPKKEPKPIGDIRIMDGMHLVESAKDVPAWITEQTGRIPPGWRYIQITDDRNADKLVCGYDYEGRLQVKYSAGHTRKQAARKFRRVAVLRENARKVEDGIRGIDKPDVRDCLLLIMETGLRPDLRNPRRAAIMVPPRLRPSMSLSKNHACTCGSWARRVSSTTTR